MGETVALTLDVNTGLLLGEAEGQALTLLELEVLPEGLGVRLSEGLDVTLDVGVVERHTVTLLEGQGVVLSVLSALRDCGGEREALGDREEDTQGVGERDALTEGEVLELSLGEREALGQAVEDCEPEGQRVGEGVGVEDRQRVGVGEGETEKEGEGETLGEALRLPEAQAVAVNDAVAQLLGDTVAVSRPLPDADVLGDTLGLEDALRSGEVLVDTVPQAEEEPVSRDVLVLCALMLPEGVRLTV